MSCFPCFKPRKSHSNKEQVPVAQTRDVGHQPTQPVYPKQNPPTEVNNKKDDANPVDTGNIAAKTFTFRELATATKNFRQECLIGEGGFGRLFRGTLQPNGQVVAVKQLDKNSMQGNKEFLVEILMLSLLHHPNLVHLIGYCADGDQRLLVYEYMSRGSVEDHLLDVKPDKKPLDWVTRMKIASGTAQGLEYLHEKANPPIIYRDLKSSNIMLDEEFNPRLLDYGLAKLGGNKTHVTPRVMGNYGYCAPEYERYGELTLKSDVYSFGVVLLELITGRRALDTSRPTEEQNLVTWAQPIFRDPKRFPEMADPLLGNEFPVRSLNQAVGVAAMCLQDEAAVRPLITDVVAALSFLAVAPPDEPIPATLPAPIPLSDHHAGDSLDHEYEQSNNNHEDDDHHSGDSSDRVLDEESNTNQHLLKVDDHQNGDRSDRVGEERNNIQHVPKDDDQEDRGGLDYESWDSSLSSDSEEEYQEGKVESIKLGSSLGHQGKLEFEVASMSSSSISSSDDESHRGSINQRGSSNAEIQHGNSTSLKLKRKSTKKSHKDSGSINQRGSSNAEIQHGNSTSLKLKRKSTKKSHKDTVRSSSERKTNKESWNGGLGSSSLQSYQPGIVRLDSKGSSNNELDNGNVGSSTKQESSRRSRSGSIG